MASTRSVAGLKFQFRCNAGCSYSKHKSYQRRHEWELGLGPISATPPYECVTGYNLNNKLEEAGTYSLKIALYYKQSTGVSKWPTADATIEWTYNPNDGDALIQRAQESQATIGEVDKKVKAEEQTARNIAGMKEEAEKLEATSMPSAWTTKSGPLAGGLTLTQVRQMATKEMQGYEIVKLFVDPEPSSGWLVDKNDYGIPTCQYLDQSIIGFFKANGKCYWLAFDFRKNYLGGGKYAGVIIHSNPWNELPCSKMK